MLSNIQPITKLPNLAIFDLDETLIAADSASLWVSFIVEKGLADERLIAQERALMKDYAKGSMDMQAYMAATLAPIAGKAINDLAPLIAEFVETRIEPAIYPDAIERIAWHKKRGDRVIIISATGEHLVKPIAEHLGVDDSLAIKLESINGIYTGSTTGVLSYREGKVTRLEDWLQTQQTSFSSLYCYTDSINDLPLLQAVEHPFAVNPDPTLALHAQMQEWTMMDWRHQNDIQR
ncbi:HAD family phosphatase [Photobacterium sp. 1_MG-2023]|uniref:HAD family hydrolase n=1 Tax=Photobacterium sp. 1_MG-2023 TaxID=3062646 RepID=UPI0026E3D525|nr:HAD family hydrolase [Photobacterium sp. 1_MG-2023]MDO6705945.1 HAD family hydrolase [Photobacterium sp. 1_MG-2023]